MADGTAPSGTHEGQLAMLRNAMELNRKRQPRRILHEQFIETCGAFTKISIRFVDYPCTYNRSEVGGSV